MVLNFCLGKTGSNNEGAVDVFMIGCFGKGNLMTATSEFNNPSYRLELILEPDTITALRTILNDGPLKDVDNVNYPLLGRSGLPRSLRSCWPARSFLRFEHLPNLFLLVFAIRIPSASLLVLAIWTSNILFAERCIGLVNGNQTHRD